MNVKDERPTTPREEIGRWIARVHRKRFQLCEMMLGKMGIGPGQVPILRELSYHGDMTQRELAEHTHVTAATISGTLKRMERANLIKRANDEKDARVSIVSLTEEGVRIADEADRLFSGANELMLENVSEEECALIYDCLVRMRENLTEAIEKIE